MPPAVLAWLLAQLGPSTNTSDLEARYTRLGKARAVAAEVLAERRAKLLADPLRITVNGVVTLDQAQNLAGIERQIADLADTPAPDDVAQGAAMPEAIVSHLTPARSTR
ncbi:hypothetical protein GCM10020367_21040 [Streptomyces sannanensis]|uniref:Uncharacterized protein n=1 Tax=Streptomyces sannanensis TaxID=285536 RepID=A0ABP6S9U8_9ACTN